ncbi:MAG: glycoside hydrolase family 5 protein [Treponema sp.]|jgi:endoglucanase|nr:glycoside hydrolase family 5 protein [Treponema sp.]
MKTRNIFFLLAAIILLSDCQTAKQTQDMYPHSAAEFVRDMGIGINIGNTLDSIGTNTWFAGETGWGNPRISRSFIRALKDYGYKTIRLPVTWAENMGPAPDYEINEDWMYRVEEVVGWILAEDMYCILNLHHDGGGADKSWIRKAAGNPDGVIKQFAAVWTQIARRFSGASEKLIFEAMNEVAVPYPVLNRLNQTFVDTVRASGSNNASRFLLIAGYDTDIDRTRNIAYLMPKDTSANKLILSIHYYTPSTFCIAEQPNNSWGFRSDWGSEATRDADMAELQGQFAKLKLPFLDRGIPVIIGEYGVTTMNKAEEGRVRWMTAVTQICLDYGMCPVLWDTGGDIKRNSPFAMSDPLAAVWENIKSANKL